MHISSTDSRTCDRKRKTSENSLKTFPNSDIFISRRCISWDDVKLFGRCQTHSWCYCLQIMKEKAEKEKVQLIGGGGDVYLMERQVTNCLYCWGRRGGGEVEIWKYAHTCSASNVVIQQLRLNGTYYLAILGSCLLWIAPTCLPPRQKATATTACLCPSDDFCMSLGLCPGFITHDFPTPTWRTCPATQLAWILDNLPFLWCPARPLRTTICGPRCAFAWMDASTYLYPHHTIPIHDACHTTPACHPTTPHRALALKSFERADVAEAKSTHHFPTTYKGERLFWVLNNNEHWDLTEGRIFSGPLMCGNRQQLNISGMPGMFVSIICDRTTS